MSFPYTEDRSKATRFRIEDNDAINVFIGPNGSGKTNFLKIIRQMLTAGVIEDMVYVDNPEEKSKTIWRNQNTNINIKPHFLSPEKPSFARIEISITPNDKENLQFLQSQRVILNNIIQTYSTIWYAIPAVDPKDIWDVNKVWVNFDVDTKAQTITAKYDGNNPVEQFAFDMLKYQEIFHLCISIFNEKIKTAEEAARYPLKNTFSYLDYKRNFDKIQEDDLNHQAREHYVGKKNNNSSNFPGYALCIRKLRNIIDHHSEENAHIIKPTTPLSQEEIDKKLMESDFFLKVHASIKKYLELELKAIYHGENIELVFIDTDNISHNIHDLSHGEQSLLIILMSIYGHDLKDGMLIIDEPEMHFHPQIQRRLSNLLSKLSKEMGTQCILSTYSPIFINEKNIENVYRFNKVEGATNITYPDKSIGEDESSLMQILKFENTSKIFFADTIIMVEWEIDAYFFEFYLQYLHKFPERKDCLKNYEIININGKGSYRKRHKFLKRFNIESYFIWDRDNIVDYGFVSQSDLTNYYKEAKRYYSKRGKWLWDRHYTKLVTTVKELHGNQYNAIIQHITNLYKEDVFILQRWDIETYLGMKAKGLEETIDFCHNFFDIWLQNPDLKEHREEFNAIISQIFKKCALPASTITPTDEVLATRKALWIVQDTSLPLTQETKQQENTLQTNIISPAPISIQNTTKKTDIPQSINPSVHRWEDDIIIWHHDHYY